MRYSVLSTAEKEDRVLVFPVTLLRNSEGAGDSKRPAEQFQIILMEKKYMVILVHQNSTTLPAAECSTQGEHACF